MRRLALTLTLCASLALPVGGCSPTPTTPVSPATAATPPNAGEVLAAAIAKTSGVSLKVELSASTGDHFFGDYDSANRVAALQQAPGGADVTITVTPTDYYLSGPKTPMGKTWHLTIAKLRADSSQTLLTDVVVALTLLTEATGVLSTKPDTFTGHIDATRLKAATPGTQKFLDHIVKAGGTGARALVFVATLDQRGYLSSFKTTLPNLAGGTDVVYELKFSDFGAALNIAIPSGQNVIDAPDNAYATI
jgi:hypothetical protein